MLLYLAALPGSLDAVLLTAGDIADHGEDAEYALAAKLFASQARAPDLPGQPRLYAARTVPHSWAATPPTARRSTRRTNCRAPPS